MECSVLPIGLAIEKSKTHPGAKEDIENSESIRIGTMNNYKNVRMEVKYPISEK